MAEIYFSGQGIVYSIDRNPDGTINSKGFRDLGNVPSLQLTLETDVLEHKESRTGNRLTDLRLVRERSATITMTIESFTKENLMALLYGTATVDSGALVTGEAFPSGLVIGDTVALDHPLVDPAAAFTIEDSAGSPLTLVEGTHYTVNKDSGIVTMLAVPGTQPYLATYTHEDKDVIQMFKSTQVERFLRFSGLNTANSNRGVVVELYRVVFDPVSNFDLINDELAQYELTGTVLYDSTRDLDASLGGFGRIIQAQ